MSSQKFDLPSYRNYVRYSHEKHILVEGKDDKRIFLIFLDQLARIKPEKSFRNIRVESAEQLLSSDSKLGNREKVELVCNNLPSKGFEKKLVGFVDREFREFDKEPCLNDRIQGHKISQNLVWSRGHSMENYYFDFDILRLPLLTFSTSDNFLEALNLFQSVFEQTIRFACASSLASEELELIKPIKNSISNEIFSFDKNQKLVVEITQWNKILISKQKLSSELTDTYLDRFQFWYQKVEQTVFYITRWLCHGHIGLAFIWASYSYCVLAIFRKEGLDLKNAKSEAQKVLKAEESVRFTTCANLWAQKALGERYEYPTEVFKLIDSV